MDIEASTPAPSILDLDKNTRSAVWERVKQILEDFAISVDELPVAPHLDLAGVRGWVEAFTFQQPIAPVALLDILTPAWKKH